MANTEDYLDSLLNSINNTNMSGKKSKSYSGSDPYDNCLLYTSDAADEGLV